MAKSTANGVKFRQWANQVLRDHLLKGYSINHRMLAMGGTEISLFKHFLILNGQRLEADVAYTQIYGMAKKSVLIVDDYLDVKTLDLLRCVAKDVSVKIFSEQHGRTRLTESMLAECQRRSFKFLSSTSVMETPISGENIYK